MDLLQLRYFYESAQNENFSETAKKHFVPPSSVSAAVKRLEDELGVALFDRTSNRIKLNRQGRVLADSLSTVFSALDGAISTITTDRSEPVEISILIRARSKWITDLAIEYKQSHPEVSFRISNVKSLEEFNSFDIIIDQQSDWYGDRERFLLSIEQLCIKASKNSPLAGKTLTVNQLRDESFVTMGKGSAMRRLLEETGQRHGFTPNITIECNDRQCLFRCIEQGMGLDIGSLRSLNDDEQKNIVALNVTDFNEIQSVYVYHRPRPSNPVMKDFLRFLKTKSRT